MFCVTGLWPVCIGRASASLVESDAHAAPRETTRFPRNGPGAATAQRDATDLFPLSRQRILRGQSPDFFANPTHDGGVTG
jgi:hypothetical protein